MCIVHDVIDEIFFKHGSRHDSLKQHLCAALFAPHASAMRHAQPVTRCTVGGVGAAAGGGGAGSLQPARLARCLAAGPPGGRPGLARQSCMSWGVVTAFDAPTDSLQLCLYNLLLRQDPQ